MIVSKNQLKKNCKHLVHLNTSLWVILLVDLFEEKLGKQLSKCNKEMQRAKSQDPSEEQGCGSIRTYYKATMVKTVCTSTGTNRSMEQNRKLRNRTRHGFLTYDKCDIFKQGHGRVWKHKQSLYMLEYIWTGTIKGTIFYTIHKNQFQVTRRK